MRRLLQLRYLLGQQGERLCILSGNQVYGIKSSHSKVNINSNYISGPSPGYGIYVQNPEANVRLNTIDSAQYGIYLRAINGASTTVYGNEVTGAGYRGIHVQDVFANPLDPVATRIRHNDVHGYFSQCHLYLNNANLVRVDTCSFLTGDTVETSRSLTGIMAINSDSTKVRGSVIMDYCMRGFYADNQTTADLGIHSSDGGMNWIATDFVPGEEDPRPYAVVNGGSDTLKAEDNYWGTSSPGDTLFWGPVDYDPWLSNPPGLGKIQIVQNDNRPKEFTLSQNYPNPFNPNTVIKFTLPEASRISVKVYNILGQLVKKVVDEELPAGVHTVIWNGEAQSGEEVTSGIYFYVVKAGDFRAVKKMVLLR